MTAKTQTFLERFWSKVDTLSGPAECWPWLAGVNKVTGYGAFVTRWESGFYARMIGAHVIAYELSTTEQIPRGYEIHHTCLLRKCCNPNHLEMLTKSEHRKLHRRLRSEATCS